MKLYGAALLIVACACQLTTASEDWDWGDAQTAVWAIARENSIVLDMHREASDAVDQASQAATKKANDLVAEQFAAWLAPVEEATKAATEAGANASSCSFYLDWDYHKPEVTSAVPLCLVAGRAQWDAQVAKLKDVADNMLQLIIKAQSQSKACDSRPGALLQALCRQTEVTWTVLSAQDHKSKAVTPYWHIMNKAPNSIVQDTALCIQGQFRRSDLGVTNGVQNTLITSAPRDCWRREVFVVAAVRNMLEDITEEAGVAEVS